MSTTTTTRTETQPSLARLVTAAADGDDTAWRHLVERYGGMVLGSAMRVRGLSYEDYDDAVATTWLRFVDDIHKLRHPAAAAGWLKVTAYREALRLLRLRQRTVSVEDRLDELGAEPDLCDEMLCDQIRATVIEAMPALSPTGRLLLAALLNDPDLSYKEIEERYGIGVSSIGPIRRRVLQNLEVALSRIGVSVPGVGTPLA